jgi:hypothetical protein
MSDSASIYIHYGVGGIGVLIILSAVILLLFRYCGPKSTKTREPRKFPEGVVLETVGETFAPPYTMKLPVKELEEA